MGGGKRKMRGGAVFPSFVGGIGGTTAGAEWGSSGLAAPYSSATGQEIPDPYSGTGGRRRMTMKALKKALKKAGLKTTGKKAALTRRLKKAGRSMKGGGAGLIPSPSASAGYSGSGTAGLINVSDVSTGVSNDVVPSA